MAHTRRLWVPVLVALLVTGLLGVAGGGGAVAVEPRLTVASIMIPAAAFIPTSGSWSYSQTDSYLTANNTADFTAPLTFPVQEVTIRRITLYAYENTADGSVCVRMFRASPRTASSLTLGSACTVNSTTNPQAATTTAISPRRVNTAVQGPDLWVSIPGSQFSTVRFYGVKVTYSY